MPALVTGRLRLRPCSLDDLDPLHALCTRPEIRRFLFDDRPITRCEAQALIEASTASFQRHGYGLWLYFDAASIDSEKIDREHFFPREAVKGMGELVPYSMQALHERLR